MYGSHISFGTETALDHGCSLFSNIQSALAQKLQRPARFYIDFQWSRKIAIILMRYSE
jgi:hypothetical protein